MAKIFYFMLLLSVVKVSMAQSAWETVNSDSLITFDMPLPPAYKDTLNTSFYYTNVDTLLGLQVHVFKHTNVSDSTGFFQAALDESGGDTLQAIVKLMIAIGNYQILSLDYVNYMSVPGMEVGLSAVNPDSPDRNTVVFIKLFYYNRSFISFTITSYASDIDRLMAHKIQFFNSVVLK